MWPSRPAQRPLGLRVQSPSAEAATTALLLLRPIPPHGSVYMYIRLRAVPAHAACVRHSIETPTLPRALALHEARLARTRPSVAAASSSHRPPPSHPHPQRRTAATPSPTSIHIMHPTVGAGEPFVTGGAGAARTCGAVVSVQRAGGSHTVWLPGDRIASAVERGIGSLMCTSHMRRSCAGRACGLLTRHVRTAEHTSPLPSPAVRRLYTHPRVPCCSTSPLSSPPKLGASLSKRAHMPAAMSTSTSEAGDAVERTQRYHGPVGKQAITAQLSKLHQALPGFVLKVSYPPNALRARPPPQRQPRPSSAAAAVVLCLSSVRSSGQRDRLVHSQCGRCAVVEPSEGALSDRRLASAGFWAK